MGEKLPTVRLGSSERLLTLYREQKTRLVDVAIIERPAPKADFLARRALAPAADLPARAAGLPTSARRAF